MQHKIQQLLKQANIIPSELESRYGQKSVQRGVSYFNDGMVLDYQELASDDPKTTQVIGTVLGSYAADYETLIKLKKTGYRTSVSSYCDCPVHINCKHGIALLLSYLSNPTADSSDPVTQWLEKLVSDKKEEIFELPSYGEDKPLKHDILYLLDADRNTHKPTVQLVKARILKNGGYGKTYPVRSDRDLTNYASYAPNVTPDDEMIVKLLLSSKSSINAYSSSTLLNLELVGEIGELAFKKILKTARCHWQSPGPLGLQLGDDRTALTIWESKSGNLIPKIGCEPKADTIFKIHKKAYYIDEWAYEYGHVISDTMASENIAHFMDAPTIPKEQAAEVSEQLQQIFPDSNFPVPTKQTIKTKKLKNVQPSFHLKLFMSVDDDFEDSFYETFGAKFTIKYDNIEIDPRDDEDSSISTYLIDNVRYRLHRQNDLESDAEDLLIQAGFEYYYGSFSEDDDFNMVMGGHFSEQVIRRMSDFVESTIPTLEAQGWEIEFDDSYNLSIDTIDEWHAELAESDTNEWFEMSLGFELNGEYHNLLPTIVDLLARAPSTQELKQALQEQPYLLMQMGESNWVKIPTSRLSLVMDTMIELYDTEPLNADGNLMITKQQGLNYGDLLNDPKMEWKGAQELKQLHDKLADFSGIQPIEAPDNLQAELREYQKDGVNWLQFLREYSLNGILADDMGLGKTLQTLTSLLHEKNAGRAETPSLVVAPTSLMSNWFNEAKRFTPALKTLILQGADRKDKFDQMSEQDVIITTYPLIWRDLHIYEQMNFHYVILDEAQAIKNPKSKTSQTIFGLKAKHRLCLTGTPIENHLGELWSMFHFLMPGYLGTQEKFNRLFRNPIEKEQDHDRSQQLAKRVQPFLLRRTKDLVAKELPEKTEIIRSIPISGKQRDLYETVRLAMDKKVRDEIKKKGLARSHIMILDALLKLRQVCCDPQLVKLDKAKKVKESAKMNLLMDILPEMVEEGRKILLFSQFTSMLSIIETQLKKHKISYSKLTGQTRKREEAIADFQEGDAKVFLISLKAGGVGLNLTAADTVIHYDPWWNPAVEKQATDRAYRIGQDKPVFVYKLLTEDTVEEKILKMQEKKQQLADSVYASKDQDSPVSDQADLMDLLRPIGEP